MQTYEIPRHMLAVDFDKVDSLGEYYIQPKLRGIRAWLHKGRIFTRMRRELDIFKCRFSIHSAWLDGELYVHGWSQERLNSACLRDEPNEDTALVEFHCFDIFMAELPAERFKYASEIIDRLKAASPQPMILVQTQKLDIKCCELYYHTCCYSNYEGAIYRDPSMPYVQGRTKALLKRKPWLYGCGKVLAAIEGKGKCKGILGHFRIKWENKIFSIGGGNMSYEQRAEYLKLAPDYIYFRYRELSTYGTPIAPQYVNPVKWSYQGV